MNKRSLRSWMLIGIVSLVLIPYVGTLALVLITGAFEPEVQEKAGRERDPAALEALFRRVESQSERWEDPALLQEIRPQLDELGVDVTVYRAGVGVVLTSGERLVRSPGITRVYLQPDAVRQVVVYQGDQEAGQVSWYYRDYPVLQQRHQFYTIQNIIIGWIGVPALIIGTITLAVWLASRAILNPLQTLSHAAWQVNRGKLDFEVPESPIKEVHEFARAFDRMRNGLKESLEQQAAMEQERRLFIAGLAHDLRTPLSSVRGYLEGLRDGVANTPEKQQRYISVALEKTGSLERLIESFFAFAKTEYLEQPPQIEPLRLGDLLEGAVTGLRPRAEAKGVAITLDDGPEPCQVQGDPHMLARVIDNLLDNAIRHTPAGGTVTVGWRGGVDQCRFWVQDSGPGLPPEDLHRVFQPLYRGDKARGTRTGGAGLGLAIARRLVQAHGGQITVENREGARFTVVLPSS